MFCGRHCILFDVDTITNKIERKIQPLFINFRQTFRTSNCFITLPHCRQLHLCQNNSFNFSKLRGIVIVHIVSQRVNLLILRNLAHGIIWEYADSVNNIWLQFFQLSPQCAIFSKHDALFSGFPVFLKIRRLTSPTPPKAVENTRAVGL